MNELDIDREIKQLEEEIDWRLSCDLPIVDVERELELLKQTHNEGG